MNSIRAMLVQWGIAVLASMPPMANAQFHFYGVGDLPGGIVQSEVRDTTRVGNVLYAVGASAANAGSAGNDTAFLWTSTGGMTALPPLAPGVVGTSSVIANGITPDGAYIASRARFNPGAPLQEHAVRVTTTGMVNLDLGALPGYPQYSATQSISNDGLVLYGIALHAATGQFQAVRFAVSGPTVTAIPFLNPGDDSSVPTGRRVSSDGSVMVGTSANSAAGGGNPYGPSNAAFRYVEGSGVSAIPFLSGGTWNIAVDLSPDGNLAMVIGDSAAAPNGEVSIYNATTTAGTAWGTPAAGWLPNAIGGMTSDGTVAAIRFYDLENPAGGSFVHNASGWHELQVIVSGAGIDLTGWTLDVVNGISQDGTRVWGSGVHNGNREGFIVEFPARYLAVYGASLPAQAIVGSYSGNDTTMEGAAVIVFLANGTYFDVEDARAVDAPDGVDGFERGTYTWDAATKAFTLTNIIDTNGDYGPAGFSGVPGITVTKLGSVLTLALPGAGGGAYSVPQVTGNSPLVGTWVIGDTTLADSSAIATFFANGTYLQAYDGPVDVNHPKGIERGTYTWDSATGAFTATALVDTNGTAGFSHPTGSVTIIVTGNTLTYTGLSGPGTAYRVVAAPLAPSVAVGMSHKVHGGGGPFDLVTSVDTANPTIEPRVGPSHNMVFTFDKPVIAGVATVTEGAAIAGTPIFNASTMTVPLTGVTDIQHVTVTVSNVVSADGGTGGSGVMVVGFLAGDVNQNRVVTVADLGQVNAQLAQPVSTANYLKDVNANGTLTLSDKGLANAKLTNSLPPP